MMPRVGQSVKLPCMPYKDPARQREYYRNYDLARRESPARKQQLAESLERQKTAPDFRRRRVESAQRWQAANRERVRQYQREYYQANKGKAAARSAAVNAAKREARAAMLANQGGLCYLCGLDLDMKDAVTDHRHECCGANKYCADCIRGVAHMTCNTILGLVGDNPEILRRMADALEGVMS